jgi:sugar phosphate isomerase/epimerase
MERALERLQTAGLCFDCGNALVDPPLDAWLRSLGPRIRKVHLSDGCCGRDGVKEVPLGTGDVVWRSLADGLRALDGELDVFVEARLPIGAAETPFLEDLHRRAGTVLAQVTESL